MSDPSAPTTEPEAPADAPTDAPTEAAPGPALTGIAAWPKWKRTLLWTVLLGGAAVAAVVGLSYADTGEGEDRGDPAIVDLSPPDGAQSPRQTSLGAELVPGYDGRIIVNGIEVPEEQMEGARDPATTDPVDLAENGVRPNNRNRVFFRPGPGKVIEELERGTVAITVRYFPEGRPEQERTISWTIRVD